MRFEKVQKHLSQARINRYLIATANDSNRAIKLYKHNLRVSQSFLPLLSLLEVVVRNKINAILTDYFNDNDWIINQKNGFMSHPSLSYIHPVSKKLQENHFLKNSVLKSESKLKKQKLPISSGKIISDQSFGFWTELFELTFYKILKGRPIQIFTNLPSNTSRIDILHRLNKIKNFRNRISHNEPICFSNTNIDFTEAMDVHDTIIEIFNWIDPELKQFISDTDTVILKVHHAKNI